MPINSSTVYSSFQDRTEKSKLNILFQNILNKEILLNTEFETVKVKVWRGWLRNIKITCEYINYVVYKYIKYIFTYNIFNILIIYRYV